MQKYMLRMQTHLHYLATRLKTGKRPPQIIFMHVPKCAGSSASHYVKRCCGSSHSGRTMMFHDHLPTRHGRKTAIARARQAYFIAGHFSWATTQEIHGEERQTFIFTVLREPKERLRSFYYFLTRLPESRQAKGLENLYAYIDNLGPLDFFTSEHELLKYLLDNFMLRQFAGSLEEFPTTEEKGQAMLERAKRNLASLDYVGFQESFDEDFPRIIEAIGLPRVKRVPRTNVTDNLIASSEERAKVREPFSEDVNAAIEPLIRWDRQLYDFAAQELHPKQSRSE